MKKLLFLTISLILLPILQVSMAGNLTYNNQSVLNLIFVFSFSLFFAGYTEEAFLTAVVGGLVTDLVGFTDPIGLFGLLLSLVLVLAGLLKNLTHYSFPMKLLLIFLAALFLNFGLAFPVLDSSSMGNYLLSSLAQTFIFFLLYPLVTLTINRVFSQNFLQLDFRDRI